MYLKVVQNSCVSLLGGGSLGEKRREEGSGKLSNVSTELPFLHWLIMQVSSDSSNRQCFIQNHCFWDRLKDF